MFRGGSAGFRVRLRDKAARRASWRGGRVARKFHPARPVPSGHTSITSSGAAGANGTERVQSLSAGPSLLAAAAVALAAACAEAPAEERAPSRDAPVVPAAAAAERASPGDSAEVAGTVARFHAALAAGDSAGALALLAPGVRILENGSEEDLAEYRSHHLSSDMGYARVVTTRRGATSVRVQGDAAWATSTSTSTGTFRMRPVDAAGAELMVLVRTAQGWRIAAIHWSSRDRAA